MCGIFMRLSACATKRIERVLAIEYDASWAYNRGHRELKILEKPMPDAEIKRLMKNLGDSINETLAESPKINECIQNIRDAGYETFLVIEAKIGFSRKDKSEQDLTSSDEPVQLRITQDDAKFLKSLRIAVDETQ